MSNYNLESQYYGAAKPVPEYYSIQTQDPRASTPLAVKQPWLARAKPSLFERTCETAEFGARPESKPDITILQVGITLFAPWCLFAAVLWLLSFSLHYTAPLVVGLLVLFLVLLVIAAGIHAWGAARSSNEDSVGQYRTAWFKVLVLWLALAWTMAVLIGESNYMDSTAAYYNIRTLQTYENVDVSTGSGIAAMDAGIVVFKEGTTVDTSKSAAFRNDDIYCVAPLKLHDQAAENNDFWAVGRNCCSGYHGDFHCGEYNNPRANSGIRVMRDVEAQFYRLAVRQAAAEWKLQARNPVFFTWMQDPMGKLERFQEAAMSVFQSSLLGYFVFQLLIVFVQVLMFFKFRSSY